MLEEWGIKNRVLIVALLPTIIIALLLGVYFTSTRLTDLEQSLKDHGTAISIQLASSSEYGVFANNKSLLNKIIENSAEDKDVRAITIYDKDGVELTHIGPKINIKYDANRDKSPLTIINNIENNSLIFVTPIMLRDVIIDDFHDKINSKDKDITQSSINQKVIGWINIELAKTNTTLKQYQTLFTSGCILLFGLLVSGLFAKRLGSDVTSPIIKLTQAVEKIKNGNFTTRVYTGAGSEIKILESGINSMANSLKIAHNEMQKNIDEATRELRQTLETIEIQNAELDIARKEALTASKIKSEFLANMSHEIRTPMNGIIGFTQLLLKSNINEQQFDYLNTIEHSANSLLQIINDILDLSKIEADKLELEVKPFNLVECLEETVTILAPLAHNKNIELVHIIYSDVPEVIISDSLRLKQIITNLVNNAIKFSDTGSVVVRVMLENDNIINSTNNKVNIKVTVTDTGIGLSEDEKHKLFKAFSQADNKITRKYGGTGLGLVISKKLVQKMGGEIGFYSNIGEGSTFWFTFKASVQQQQINKSKLPEEINKKIIVICEAMPITRLNIKYLFKNWGIQIYDINNINNLDKLAQKYNLTNIDLLIYSLNKLDNKDGVSKDLSKINNALLKYNTNLALIVNSNNQIILNKLLKNYNISFYITKPIQNHKLFDAVKNFFNEYNTLNIKPAINNIKNTKQKISEFNNNSFSEAKILAVDDNLANLKLIESILQHLNINPLTASNGLIAEKICHEKTFDIILMDIQMPHQDGVVTTKKIKDYYKSNNINPPIIIAVTAHAILGDKQKLLAQGLDDYISKPINENVLIKLINKYYTINIQQLEKFEQNKLSEQISNQNNNTNNINTSQIINHDLSLKLANNNKELADELLDLFIKDLPSTKNNITESYINNNYDDLLHYVHKLHGSCCYVGVPLLKTATKEFEKILKTKNDFAEYSECYNNLILNIDNVLEKTTSAII